MCAQHTRSMLKAALKHHDLPQADGCRFLLTGEHLGAGTPTLRSNWSRRMRMGTERRAAGTSGRNTTRRRKTGTGIGTETRIGTVTGTVTGRAPSASTGTSLVTRIETGIARGITLPRTCPPPAAPRGLATAGPAAQRRGEGRTAAPVTIS